MGQGGYAEAFVVGGEFNSNPPAPTPGQKVPLQVDSSGNLLVTASVPGTPNVNIADVGGVAVTSGLLPVTAPSTVSAGNSSTTPLAGGGVFTGTAVDLLAYKALSIAAFSDQNGSYSVQYSEDQVNWDLTQILNVVGGVGLTNQFTIRARYFRIVYTNGGTSQTAFRLQTLLHPAALGVRLAPVSQAVLAADEALTTHSVITGLNTGGGGAYVDVKVNPSGTLATQDGADATLGGTTAPSVVMVAGGKTNDGTAQYQPLPEGPGGRSVIVEGNASGVAVNVAQATAANLNATVKGATGTPSVVTWNSSTPGGTTNVMSVLGYGGVLINITTDGGTLSAGAIRFFGQGTSSAGFSSITGMRQRDGAFANAEQLYDASRLHTLLNNDDWNYWFPTNGLTFIGVQINTAIVGTCNVTITMTPVVASVPGPTTVGQSDPTKLNATVSQPTAANLNATTVGAAGVNQTVTWTSSTPQFTFFNIPCAGYSGLAIRFHTNNGTFGTPAIAVAAATDNSGSYVAITGMRNFNGASQLYDAAASIVPAANQDVIYWYPIGGFVSVQVSLQGVITGTGTVTISAVVTNASTVGPTTVGQNNLALLNATVGSVYNTTRPSTPPNGTSVPLQSVAIGDLRTAFARGSGTIGLFSTAQPAAGADFQISVPAGQVWRILGFNAQFTASAGVANRDIYFAYNDAFNGATAGGYYPTPATVTAGQQFIFCLCKIAGGGRSIGGRVLVPFSDDIYLNNVTTFYSNTVGIQAGDQWGQGFGIAEKWFL